MTQPAPAPAPAPTPAPVPYASSPVFDETDLPASLRAEHRTKPGTWGVARVISGSVVMVYDDSGDRLTLTPGTPALLAPDQPHHVELTGPMQMQIDFYRERPEL
ncbi:DUF1971 domain-containing protein [Sphingorhabdus soli]|uniref:DUF1971 domain-containing protein n=1 Tax=Flavisphingopyxis soli TaxID=2601267 RepID=A0A5C6U5Z8_9SPHN|nr:DUF1971 domain-containing protein [Sphingorhabdus soli]TXC68169.1 DUF1971 domain-containing protein [Sphingorhabdus soli]